MNIPCNGLIAILGAVMLVPVSTAFADSPHPVTSNLDIPFSLALRADTETIQVTGNMHIEAHVITTTAGIGGDIHIKLFNTSGIGLSSGNAYHVGGIFNGSIPAGFDIDSLAEIVLMDASEDQQHDLEQIMQGVVFLHFDNLRRLVGAYVEPAPCNSCSSQLLIRAPSWAIMELLC